MYPPQQPQQPQQPNQQPYPPQYPPQYPSPYPPQYPPPGVKPPNYLVPAILTTIFCCLPFGIVAIVYAAQVDSKMAMGDYGGAIRSSNAARNWSIASAASAVVILILYFILLAAGVATFNFSTS